MLPTEHTEYTETDPMLVHPVDPILGSVFFEVPNGIEIGVGA
jgi:hypothetical protein